MEVLKKLIQKAVAGQKLIVLFDIEKQPKYIPSHQTNRSDKKAVIEMPHGKGRNWIDHNSTDAKIDEILEGVVCENALLLFAHEYGHHLTNNPGYDAALKNCLELPVKDRSDEDKRVVIKEENEAWDLGFSELQSLGYVPSVADRELAIKNVQEYSTGVATIEPRSAVCQR